MGLIPSIDTGGGGLDFKGASSEATGGTQGSTATGNKYFGQSGSVNYNTIIIVGVAGLALWYFLKK